MISKDKSGNYLLIGTDGKPVPRPSGSYDKTILCNGCDNKLGRYDLAAVTFCNNAKLEEHPSGLVYIIKNCDQEMLKMFTLSISWRASITDLKEFKQVNLGIKYEEVFREILNDERSMKSDEFPCLMSKHETNNMPEAWSNHIWSPVNGRIEKLRNVTIYLPKLYKIVMIVDQQKPKEELMKMLVGASDELIVIKMGDYRNSNEFEVRLLCCT